MTVKSLLRVLLSLATSASGSLRIVVAVKSRGQITRDCRTISALGVVLWLLQKIWLTMSKTVGVELDEIADLSHAVEQQLRRLDAAKHLGREAPQRKAAPAAAPAKFPFRGLGKAWRSKSPIPNFDTQDDTQEDTSDPPYIPKLLKKEEIPKPGVESLWTCYKAAREAKREARLQQSERRAIDPASPGKASGHEEGTNSGQWRRRWETTPRGQRATLLSETEQLLVSQLAKADISAKERRRVLSQLSSLPFERQGMILECSKAISGGKSERTV